MAAGMAGSAFRRAIFGTLGGLGAFSFIGSALGATWSSARTTPNLAEMFAIDATGEPDWLYGAEDVAGDGLTTFGQQEQNLDVRTAYAGPESQNLYLRAYISDAAGPNGNTNAYFFVNADGNTATGSNANATTVDANLTGDTSAGGYDYVIGIKGNGTPLGIWNWSGSQWNSVAATSLAGEAGTDVDPIRINGDTHGYIQASVALSAVGLTAACSALFFVRTTHDTLSGDLDVGQAGTCDPSDTDANNNTIPDVLEPTSNCTTNAECPGGGICLSGNCVFATPCIDNTDCRTDEACTPDGICLPRASGTCASNADCGDRVCEGGRCDACMPGGIQCDAGRVCAPTGRCVDDPSAGTGGTGGIGAAGTGGTGGGAGGTGGRAGSTGTGGFAGEDQHDPLEPRGAEDVQGGACVCSAPGGRTSGTLALLALPFAFLLRRRRRPLSSR
jgi:hypothetical protein